MGEKAQVGELQEIRYIRVVKPPTLKQYLHRRAVKEVMHQVEGESGTGIDKDTGRLIPLSSIKAKELLRGQTASDLMIRHPDWVEEYRREHGIGNKEIR